MTIETAHERAIEAAAEASAQWLGEQDWNTLDDDEKEALRANAREIVDAYLSVLRLAGFAIRPVNGGPWFRF